MPAPSRVYLAPGMFGFARLASFEYFEHVVRALEERFRARGRAVEVHVVEVHPTASVRRRAAKLARMVLATSAGDRGPIHLMGHSTGGLDARLVASPSVQLGEPNLHPLAWGPRLCSVTTLNTPHYGTPLASFFATVSGQRMLYAVSALTVTALKLGAPPLAATSALIAAFGRLQLNVFELELVDRTVEAIVKVLDEASSRELRAWLKLLRDDQGGIVQIMPEAMDVFQAAVEDRPGVRYQCVATFAPGRGATDWLAALRSPWGAISAPLFAALHQITGRHQERYPCAPADGSAHRVVRAMLGEEPPLDSSDGIVPLYSQNLGRARVGGPGRSPQHRRPLPRRRRPHRLALQRRPVLARALRPGHGPRRRRDAPRRRGPWPRRRLDDSRVGPDRMTQARRSLATLNAALVECRRCPRLVSWREQVAREKRRAYRDETYWGRPVPGFGDPEARLIVVGLAPGAHGANRTGRMFTGDRSGDFLYAALHRAEIASQPESRHVDDGLTLRGAYVTAPVRCAPPDNKPALAEIDACRSWLEEELSLLRHASVYLALGKTGYNAVVKLSRSRSGAKVAAPPFGHGVEATIPDPRTGEGQVRLFASYHVSQQNTQTGRLTPAMFDAAVAAAVAATRAPQIV